MSSRSHTLSAGAFAVGTSAYVVSGLLSEVSHELDVSVAAAGQLATVFALAYAVGAPVLATVTGGWERRTLLVVALVVAAAGNALSAVAPTYPLLLAGRVVAALGAAVYTPAATLFATDLLPPAERGRAVARVFGGLTFALVLGVPAGNVLGERIGYHGVFGLVALACLASAAGVRLLLPRMEPPPIVPLRERFTGLGDLRVLTALTITVLGLVSAISVYTYALPLLEATAGITGATAGAVLLAYGIGAVAGNAVGGRATDRFGSRRTLLVSVSGFVVLVATLSLTARTVAGASVALFVMGVFGWLFNPPMQNLLLRLGPNGGLLLSLNASAIYLGAGLGGIVGGLVIETVGIGWLPLVSAALAVVALALVATLRTPGTATAPQAIGVASEQ